MSSGKGEISHSGNLVLKTGDLSGAGSGESGRIELSNGRSDARSGGVRVAGGETLGSNQNGGKMDISGGDNTADDGGNGGNITLLAGNSFQGAGGSLSFASGVSKRLKSGEADIRTGDGAADGSSGNIDIHSGTSQL